MGKKKITIEVEEALVPYLDIPGIAVNLDGTILIDATQDQLVTEYASLDGEGVKVLEGWVAEGWNEPEGDDG